MMPLKLLGARSGRTTSYGCARTNRLPPNGDAPALWRATIVMVAVSMKSVANRMRVNVVVDLVTPPSVPA